jgi:hypothetical protein
VGRRGAAARPRLFYRVETAMVLAGLTQADPRTGPYLQDLVLSSSRSSATGYGSGEPWPRGFLVTIRTRPARRGRSCHGAATRRNGNAPVQVRLGRLREPLLGPFPSEPRDRPRALLFRRVPALPQRGVGDHASAGLRRRAELRRARHQLHGHRRTSLGPFLLLGIPKGGCRGLDRGLVVHRRNRGRALARSTGPPPPFLRVDACLVITALDHRRRPRERADPASSMSRAIDARSDTRSQLSPPSSSG